MSEMYDPNSRQACDPDRGYDAGFSDMRSMAIAVCIAAGRGDLANLIKRMAKPPSGDK